MGLESASKADTHANTTKIDPCSEGAKFAHQLADGAATSNINYRIYDIDAKLNSMSATDRNQALAAMDAELTQKGLLPSAMQIFAEQTDNHNILKADRRGVHADTLEYNLNPDDPRYANKLKGGHWSQSLNPVEMMLTKDIAQNVTAMTPPGDDEVTYGRMNKYVGDQAKHYGDVTAATAMLKDFGNKQGFYDISNGAPRISKDNIENALAFGGPNTDQKTLQWMKDHYKQLSDHGGGITAGSMRRFAATEGVFPAPISPVDSTTTPSDKPSQTPDVKVTPTDKVTPTTDHKTTDHKTDASAQTPKKTDAHSQAVHKQITVKPGETMKDVAIAELKAEGKLSANASAHDLASAHKQIAYEEHLIRLYTRSVFKNLPNYEGKLKAGTVLNVAEPQSNDR